MKLDRRIKVRGSFERSGKRSGLTVIQEAGKAVMGAMKIDVDDTQVSEGKKRKIVEG